MTTQTPVPKGALAVCLVVLLQGCAAGGCLFGGATEAEDAVCAERNFGPAGAAELQQRNRVCEQVCPLDDLSAEQVQWCILNCPDLAHE